MEGRGLRLGEQLCPASPAGPIAHGIAECRRLVFHMRFEEAVELAAAGARRARRDGEWRALRRFANQQAAALIDLGRFTEALALCDEVVATTPEHEDPGAVAHACNIGTVAAARAGRDDVLVRLDAAVRLGEWFHAEHGRLDSLVRAACTIGTVGLAELGDGTFARVMADVESGVAGELAPRALLWLRSQQISVRLWWALALEHEGDPRCLTTYAGAVELTRRARADLRGTSGLPARIAAVFDAVEGVALAAQGLVDAATASLRAAATVLPDHSRDVFGAAVELLHGVGVLRTCGPEALAVTPRCVLDGMVRAARHCGDARFEAEAWRLGGLVARAAGDDGRAGLAAERFDALRERLDWRRRLQAAEVLTLRSATLRRIAAGGGWAPCPAGSGR